MWPTRIGCSSATVILIAMSVAPIAATVRCGRHSMQSRKRIVEAVLVTCEQREAETPGHACAVPVRRCQPAAGANCAGFRRGVPADAVRKSTLARTTEPATKAVMRAKRLMPNVTLEVLPKVPSASDPAVAWASVQECPLSRERGSSLCPGSQEVG